MVAMRWLVVVALLATNAWADKKIVDMTPGYKREADACAMQEGGLGLMVTRTRSFVATNPPDKAELEKDVERLAKGHQIVVAYCAEVTAFVKFLEDNASAAYKTVQKELGTRSNAVRKARTEAKKWIEELAPITRKLIPRVTQRVAQVEERKQTGKFPSGRIVELPAVTGSWKLGGTAITDIAEYTTDGTTATVTTHPFSKATCEQQRKQFAAKAGDEPIADLELSAAAKAIGIEWAWRYVRRDAKPHMLTMMCVPAGAGGFVALTDMTPADQLVLADEMTKLMVTMLALQLPKPISPPTTSTP